MTTEKITVNPNVLNFQAQRDAYMRGLADQAGGKGELRKLRMHTTKLETRMGNLRTRNAELTAENKRLRQQLNDRTTLESLVGQLQQQAAASVTPTPTKQLVGFNAQ